MTLHRVAFGWALVILLSISACGGSSGSAVGRALVGSKGGFDVFAAGLPATVQVFTAGSFKARESVTLESARPVRLTRGTQILATRINFVGPTPGRPGINGAPGSFCTTWPVKGFGPTYRAHGLHIHRGDVFAVTFFVRSSAAVAGSGSLTKLFDETGPAMRTQANGVVAGVRVQYRDGGRHYRQDATNGALYMHVRADPRDLPPNACKPGLPSIFTGNERTGESFHVFTPPPK